MNCSSYEYFPIHIYFFDSMSTRIREFRTIKSAEFYPTAEYILNPSMITKNKQEHESENSADKVKSTLLANQMKGFIEAHSKKFNSS